MPADVYLKTTNYPARPYAGPGIPHTPQLVPGACPPTLTRLFNYCPHGGPRRGQGQRGMRGRERRPAGLTLALGVPPASPFPALSGGHWWWALVTSAPSHREPQRWKGRHSAMPPGLGTAPASWHPPLPQHQCSLPVQVLPYSPSGAGRGCFHPQTHLSQPSTPSLLPRPRKD